MQQGFCIFQGTITTVEQTCLWKRNDLIHVASVNDVKRSIFLNIGYSFSINHYFCFKSKPFSLVMPKFKISNIHMGTDSIIINWNKTFKAGAIVLDSKSTFSTDIVMLLQCCHLITHD